MDISPADVLRIRELYGRGRYRLAYEAAAGFGPFRAWANTPARLIGGRLAIQLGAPKLGRQLHALAYRSTPSHPEALYYHARYRLERFGPLATWHPWLAWALPLSFASPHDSAFQKRSGFSSMAKFARHSADPLRSLP